MIRKRIIPNYAKLRLIDFVVSANCLKQDNLFLSLGVPLELKYDAIFEIDCTGPGTCQVSFQLMDMERRVKCIICEQF